MKNFKWLMGILALCVMFLAIFLSLRNEHSVLTHPKGMVARKELEVIAKNYLIMSIIVVPTLIVLFVIAWKYRSHNQKAKYDPDHSQGLIALLIPWILPALVIAIMTSKTWFVTHELDPYRPIKNGVKPLTIQVMAMDWKWLFIYPEQGIATLNFVQFPEGTPIDFELAADGSPMNSFWIPSLSGQIYSMTGMITPLHIIADGPGEYFGKAAEINGKGYAGMTFLAKSTSQADFESWVAEVQKSPYQLTLDTYNDLVQPSENRSIILYSQVENHLFMKMIHKYMQHTTTVCKKISSEN